MASIAVVGKSGTGKSTSYGQFPELGIKGLNPKETVVINVSGKDLPFRGWKKLYTGKVSEGGNYFESSDAVQIAKVIDYILVIGKILKILLLMIVNTLWHLSLCVGQRRTDTANLLI